MSRWPEAMRCGTGRTAARTPASDFCVHLPRTKDSWTPDPDSQEEYSRVAVAEEKPHPSRETAQEVTPGVGSGRGLPQMADGRGVGGGGSSSKGFLSWHQHARERTSEII